MNVAPPTRTRSVVKNRALAAAFAAKAAEALKPGAAFYAVDLRAYGRSLDLEDPEVRPGYIADLADYDAELEAAEPLDGNRFKVQMTRGAICTLLAELTGRRVAIVADRDAAGCRRLSTAAYISGTMSRIRVRPASIWARICASRCSLCAL